MDGPSGVRGEGEGDDGESGEPREGGGLRDEGGGKPGEGNDPWSGGRDNTHLE